MDIAKRLYIGVGVILCLVALLLAFAIYQVALQQRHAAEVSDLLLDVDKIHEAQKQNRLVLHRFLLNGDVRQVDAITEDKRKIDDLIVVTRQKTMAMDGQGRQLGEVLEDMRANEVMWEHEFANPMIDKRRAVDRDESTVAEMQIAFLQAYPEAWDSKEARLNKELNDFLGESTAGSKSSGMDPLTALLAQTLAGFILVVVIAMVITSKLASSLPVSQEEPSNIGVAT